MGRSPCCDKMGLKKGPWTPEEDRILVNHIRVNGHSNWRALPKQAGLLRCGKSCRLRWINYLRPDIKRGNFTQHEEQTIINLHGLLGNRWSAIAAKLPGRTDNEIKNVWHTHIKKRLPPQANNPDKFGSTLTTTATGSTTTSMPIEVEAVPARKRSRKVNMCKGNVTPKRRESTYEKGIQPNGNNEIASSTTNIIVKAEPVSPQPCTSEVSTVTSTSTNSETNPSQVENNSSQGTSTSPNDTQNNADQVENTCTTQGYLGELPDINEDFWMEVLSVEDTAISTNDLPCIAKSEDDILGTDDFKLETEYLNVVNSEDMDVFWHNLLTETLELPEITAML